VRQHYEVVLGAEVDERTGTTTNESRGDKMEEMLKEMTQQAERQMALYQALGIIGFVMGLVITTAYIYLAIGVNRAANAFDTANEILAHYVLWLQNNDDESREQPSRKAAMPPESQPGANKPPPKLR